ncbi:hypothetical protein [Sphingobacterium chuzhouense]|uniref:hypothetical protein n=1 Tax=Sphingobacterium chuzhouense TaxID=1742264 RepID=UPI00168185D7|nr:hypothetical protein [Sphingobacterium chuzhouense]
MIFEQYLCLKGFYRQTVKLIFTSESNGEIVYAIKQVTVVNGLTVAISESELNTTTKNNLVNLINALH